MFEIESLKSNFLSRLPTKLCLKLEKEEGRKVIRIKILFSLVRLIRGKINKTIYLHVQFLYMPNLGGNLEKYESQKFSRVFGSLMVSRITFLSMNFHHLLYSIKV